MATPLFTGTRTVIIHTLLNATPDAVASWFDMVLETIEGSKTPILRVIEHRTSDLSTLSVVCADREVMLEFKDPNAQQNPGYFLVVDRRLDFAMISKEENGKTTYVNVETITSAQNKDGVLVLTCQATHNGVVKVADYQVAAGVVQTEFWGKAKYRRPPITMIQ
jgi:hypothetical protein